jgi:hypothetical protein
MLQATHVDKFNHKKVIIDTNRTTDALIYFRLIQDERNCFMKKEQFIQRFKEYDFVEELYQDDGDGH